MLRDTNTHTELKSATSASNHALVVGFFSFCVLRCGGGGGGGVWSGGVASVRLCGRPLSLRWVRVWALLAARACL